MSQNARNLVLEANIAAAIGFSWYVEFQLKSWSQWLSCKLHKYKLILELCIVHSKWLEWASNIGHSILLWVLRFHFKFPFGIGINLQLALNHILSYYGLKKIDITILLLVLHIFFNGYPHTKTFFSLFTFKLLSGFIFWVAHTKGETMRLSRLILAALPLAREPK